MNEVLSRWNLLPAEAAEREIVACCGSRSWARGIAKRRPLADQGAVFAAADDVSRTLGRSDWLEAFRSHPRIGGAKADESSGARCEAWSREEQGQAAQAGGTARQALAEGNRAYEEKFGHLFIVCATGKSAGEILEILGRRLQNEQEAEFSEAREQQRQITQLRLAKWLAT